MACSFLCTVLQVKPFSGYYVACPRCVRKLASSSSQHAAQRCYWCRACLAEWSAKELTHRYCVVLVVTDNHRNCVDVAVFGKPLESVFGMPASNLHRYLLENCGCGYQRQELIASALDTVLVGRCFSLGFRASKSSGLAPVELSQLVDSHSLPCRLVANSLQPLGSVVTVAATLQHHFRWQGNEASSQVNTSSNIAVAGPSNGKSSTPINSQSYFSSLEHFTDERSQVSQAIEFQSYHASQSPSSVKDQPPSVQMHALQSQPDAAKTLSSPALSLSAQGGPSTWNVLDYEHDQCNVVTSDGPTASVEEHLDVELSDEIVQELESEWESTQSTQQAAPCNPSSTPCQSSCSPSNLAMSEEVVEELQANFSLSQSSTPAVTSDVDGTVARKSPPECDSTTTTVCGTAVHRVRNTTICGITPELFSSSESAHSCQYTSSTGPRLQGFPKLSFSTSSTPELFETQPPEEEKVFTSSAVSSTSTPHCDEGTPALHGGRVQAARRRRLLGSGGMRQPFPTDGASFSPDLF